MSLVSHELVFSQCLYWYIEEIDVNTAWNRLQSDPELCQAIVQPSSTYSAPTRDGPIQDCSISSAFDNGDYAVLRWSIDI